MIPRYRIFRERIEAELAEAQRAAEKASQAHQLAQRGGQQAAFYLDSVALNLHGFYSGLERIFELIAREMDGSVPAGPTWHRELLTQMTLRVEGLRPAVLRPQTAQGLNEFLSFRHLVRSLYTWSFDPDRLAELIARLPHAMDEVRTDLAAFGEFLEGASRADETGE